MSASFYFDNNLTIDKKKVRQSFSSAAETYDGLATLQRKVGLDLLAKVAWQDSDTIILDIGCGTGFLTQELMLKSSAQQLIGLDIAMPMVQASRAKLEHFNKVRYLCADAEHLPLANNSVDSIYSNLALQWCQNLTSVFKNFKQVLKQDGRIYFSTFGSTTLQELKNSWAEVDGFTHVNDFYSGDELLSYLQKSGFSDIKIETKSYQSNYQTVLELMRELKGIGAHNVLEGRYRKTTSRTRMQKMVESYEKYRVNGLLPATYEVVFASAKASL